MSVGRPEGAARDKAEEEGNAPGERNEDRRPPARMQGVLLERADAALQLIKRTAVRGEEFPDAGAFGRLSVARDLKVSGNIRHGPQTPARMARGYALALR